MNVALRAVTLRFAVLSILLAGTAAAQQDDFPTSCPSLPDRRSVSGNGPRTSEHAEANRLVAEAQAALRSPSRDSVGTSIALAAQAAKADPDNVAAYLVLARAHSASTRYLDVPKKDAAQRAWENLSKARALDPAHVEGLQLLADQITSRNHDYGCAQKILERAVELEPDNARANYDYSQILGGMGRFDIAFRHADKAMAVADADSRNLVTVNAGRLRYMAGEYDWVLAHYAKYLESNPNHWLAHFYRSLAFGAKGQFHDALAEARLAMPVVKGGDSGGIGMLALAFANAGQQETARELLNELLQRDARGEHVVEYRIAAVYEVLGERDEAFRWLQKDIDDRDGLGSWLVWLNHDPLWLMARKDPRFKEIQRRAGWRD
jgi:tetratricopeptide (TPR) repeat protein